MSLNALVFVANSSSLFIVALKVLMSRVCMNNSMASYLRLR